MASSVKMITSVRIRYAISLLILAMVGTVFFIISQRNTDELLITSQIRDHLARLDIISQETAQLGLQLAQADNAENAAILNRSFVIHAEWISEPLAAIDSLWPQLPAELRSRLYDSSSGSDDPLNVYREILGTMSEAADATPEVAAKIGNRVYGIYTILGRNAFENMSLEINAYDRNTANTIQKMLYHFIAIGVLIVISFALIIFFPMERAIRRSFKELDLMRRKAELSDRAKSEFLANMSHEIRTPMNGVLGMAELLSKTEQNTKQKMFTGIIVRSGQALVTIINDILDFSKIDAGQLELNPQPFVLADAIEDVATLVSAKALEKKLELVVRIQPDLPEMFIGDVGRIRQIITNLAGNAVKFTDTGYVLVDVSGTIAEGDGDGNGGAMAALLVKVEDTGIGIPAEEPDHIFEKFSQVDGSSTRKHEGTGLGLTIARKLIELMGGEIGVESEIGKGSTFWFSLPLPVHGRAGERKRVPVDVSGARILVIDDNEINRSILLEQLSAWKFDATATPSGREGVAVLGHAASIGKPVDLVVLDYHMPVMNGAEVADLVRADPLIKDTPIVMLTSIDDDRHSRLRRDLVVQGYLVKPARSAQLFDTMIAVLQDAHQVNKAQTAEVESADFQTTEVETEEAEMADVVTDAATTDVVTDAGLTNGDAADLPPVPIGTQAGKGDGKAVVKQGRIGFMILVAEDNEVNQIVVEQILLDAGHSYAIVENGRLALEQFKAARPDLVLMDISMPEMNGLEATTVMREAEADAGDGVRTPIIGLTAHALEGDKERCLEAGMDDYMPKPISPDALKAKIAEWLAKSGTAGQSQGTSAVA